MKSLIKMFWILTLALTVNPLFANDNDPGLELAPIDAKSFAVYLDAAVECTAHIRIKDMGGVTLLNESYRNVTSLSKKINMTNLPIGTYFVEVEDRIKIQAFIIRMTSSGLTVTHQPEKDYFKPLFIQKGKYVDMCMLLLPEKYATVSIFSSNGKMLLQDVVHDEASLEKRFNVSNMERGTYYFVVTTAGKTITRAVTIR
ncbi:MAG: T9SS type A sorting domain-containing protein [Bacteroidota bacterium]